MGIEDILMYDETIFQNINAFDPDYMPPDYNHRDTQMEAMAMAIRPAMKGGQPKKYVRYKNEVGYKRSERCRY